jgi:L-ascorbate metabolism protein UlaG (beta-lactamase superfamily)
LKRKQFLKTSAFAGISLVTAPSLLKSKLPKSQPMQEPDDKPRPKEWKDTDINIAWIGHSTVLINFYGTKILTDPVLFSTIGIYFMGITFGPRRYTMPALSYDEMITPDIVLLSHAHMDHTDYKSLINLTDDAPGKIHCITAKNNADVVSDLEWKSLQEMDWNEKTELLGIKFTALEVNHFGWRFPWENDRSKGFFNGRSFNAILMEKNGKKILFGGDTSYQEKFYHAGVKDLDIAIMPIGAYNPWRRVHCNPEEALKMASEQMGAKYIIPVHCLTFQQGQEPREEPIKWLCDSAGKYNIKVGLTSIGETFTLPEKEALEEDLIGKSRRRNRSIMSASRSRFL